MAQFPLKKPVSSPVPIVTVDEGIDDGIHIFELRVEDNLGQVSDPVRLRVMTKEIPEPKEPRERVEGVEPIKPVKPKPKPKPVKPKPVG